MRSLLVCVLVLGCGDDGSPLPGPPAKVTVYDIMGKPAAGVPIVFHGIAEVKTDASGLAAHAIQPGTTITVARRIDFGSGMTQILLSSFLDAQPGDELTIGAAAGGLPDPLGSMTITAPVHAGASNYGFDTGGEVWQVPTAPMTSILVYPGSLNNGNVTVLAAPDEGSDGLFSFATVPFVAGGTVTMPDWMPASSFMVDVSTPPAAATELDVSINPSDGARQFGCGFGNTVRPPAPLQQAYPTPPTTAFPYVRVFANLQYGSAVRSYWDQRGRFASPFAIDLGQLLPAPQSPTVTGSTVAWQTTGPITSVQGMHVQIAWGTTFSTWDLTLPPAMSVDLPALPDDLADFRPTGTITVKSIDFVRSDQLTGYDDYRRGRNLSPAGAYSTFTARYSP